MNHERLPQLQEKKRDHGRPKLRFKDAVKRNVKNMDIDKSIWKKRPEVQKVGGVSSDINKESHCRTTRRPMMSHAFL